MGLGKRRGAFSLARLASWALLALVAMVWLGPYLWMVSTSLKTLPEIVAAPAYPLPSGLELGGYREVFEAVPVVRYLLNTLFMATAIATLQILLALPAGYALAKLHFAGRRARHLVEVLREAAAPVETGPGDQAHRRC